MLTSGDVQLVEDLVAKFPALEDSYTSHVFNENGVLPHVFFWDVTQEVVSSFIAQDSEDLEWRPVLAFLEEWLGKGIREANEVIRASFLWYLPNPGDLGYEIINYLGPAMTRHFHEMRPSG